MFPLFYLPACRKVVSVLKPTGLSMSLTILHEFPPQPEPLNALFRPKKN